MRVQSWMRFSIISLLLLFISANSVAQDNSDLPSAADVESRLNDALEVLQLSLVEQRMPQMLLQKAEAIVIMPSIVRLAFGFGGNFGQGILMVRQPQTGWSPPSLLTLGGGSAGFQAGIDVSNVILLFMSKSGVESMLNGSFTLGADISLTAGPVGAGSEFSTDFDSEIYAYSRSKGLFAGIALEGSVLKIDHYANATLYGAYLRPTDIFANRAATSSMVASRLRTMLNTYTFTQ